MFAAGHKTWHTAPTISCPSLSMPSTCCPFKLNPATPSWSRGMSIIFGFQMTSWGLESVSSRSKVTQTPSEGARACCYAVILNNTPNNEYSQSLQLTQASWRGSTQTERSFSHIEPESPGVSPNQFHTALANPIACFKNMLIANIYNPPLDPGSDHSKGCWLFPFKASLDLGQTSRHPEVYQTSLPPKPAGRPNLKNFIISNESVLASPDPTLSIKSSTSHTMLSSVIPSLCSAMKRGKWACSCPLNKASEKVTKQERFYWSEYPASSSLSNLLAWKPDLKQID